MGNLKFKGLDYGYNPLEPVIAKPLVMLLAKIFGKKIISIDGDHVLITYIWLDEVYVAKEMIIDNWFYSKQYQELIMAVESKYPNESRHETALRYIRERESRRSGTGKTKKEKK